jgi:Na+/H+-dicarboxylate symporter
LGTEATRYILFALVLGIIAGWATNAAIDDGSPQSAEQLKAISEYLGIITALFLRLIKMIIAPLVFATLVAGIAHMGDAAALGRIGLRSMIWFIGASLVSLTLGLLLVNLLQPGVGLDLALPAADAASGVEKSGFSLHEFITHLVPASVFEAMAKNEILQIVIFSLFFGVAITAIGEKARPIVKGVEALVHVMLQVTNYVMRVAPFAVFAAVTAAIAARGPAFSSTSTFMRLLPEPRHPLDSADRGCLPARRRPRQSRSATRDDCPRLLDCVVGLHPAYPGSLDRFGVPPRIASFVLPLGYSFNLDGSMMYMTFASIFIAQAYGIDLTLGQEITMLLVLLVTSKGMAGVPRASLVVIAATLSLFNIPEAGLLMILAVDHFLDMGRSATNVVGNAVASVAMAPLGRASARNGAADVEPPHSPCTCAA